MYKMKRYLLCFGLFSLLLFHTLSCAKTDEDTVAPEIGEIIINYQDTVMTEDRDAFYTFNIADDAEIDTLVLGKRLNFKAEFSDNEQLSSYRIHISVDPENVGVKGDTAFTAIKRWVNIFGLKHYFFEDKNNLDILIPDSLNYTGKTSKNTDTTYNRPVRNGLYKLEVSLLDIAGNESIKDVDVMLTTRKAIIDHYSK